MEEIYKSLTKGIRRSKNKTIVFLCGASGSGKTTSRQTILNEIKMKNTYITINLDDITKYDIKYDEARTILKQLFTKSVKDGYNILYDGTCRFPSYVRNLMEETVNEKYKIILVINYAELSTVVRRVKQRVDQPMPSNLVKQVYSEISKNASKYMNMDQIDELYLVSNEEGSKIIFSRKDKEIKCISPESSFYFDVSKYC